MRKRSAAIGKETNPAITEQASSENQQREPLWIERLDACLTDEFRFQLNEIMTRTYWSEVNHGTWDDPINFFEYLDRQVEIIYRLKDKPSLLRSHFESINPSLQPYPQCGSTSIVARANLPVLRQQVFLINALNIIIKKRFENNQSLRLALSVLKKLLHQKIIETLNTLGEMVKNPEWNYLANRVGRYGNLKGKADAIYLFLSETIEKNNIKSNTDRRDTLLFMQEQLEIPYEVIIQNNNKITTAFGDNKNLENHCASLYYEYYRLIVLASLEGVQQEDSTSETQSQTQESNELLTEAKVPTGKVKKTRAYLLYQRKLIIEAAVRLSEKLDKWNKLRLAEEASISESTLTRRMKFFNLSMQTIRAEAQMIIREKEA